MLFSGVFFNPISLIASFRSRLDFSNETRKRSLKDNDQKMAGNRGETDLVKVDFEVFGRVQGTCLLMPHSD
jgi:hypothetical protein